MQASLEKRPEATDKSDDKNKLVSVSGPAPEKKTGIVAGQMSYTLLTLCSLASVPLRAAVYDLSALERELESRYQITTTQFGFLLTAFYTANVATSMLASWLADHSGRRIALTILVTANWLAFVLNLLSAYTLSYNLLLLGRILSGLTVEALMPILDDTVTDYAGNKMAFALSTRNSVGQFGMIITILASPMVYNIRGSFVDCGWFMLGFISFGFAITMIVVALDTEGKQKNKKDLAKCSDIKSIPSILIFAIISATISIGLGLAASSYTTSFVEMTTSFSNQIASIFFSLHLVAQILFAPFVGIALDKFGMHSTILFIGGLMYSASFLSYALFPVCQHCWSVLFGIVCRAIGGILIIPASSSLIPLLAPVKLKSFSFSIYRTLRCVWTMVFTMLAAITHDATTDRNFGFYWMFMVLFWAEVVALMIQVVIAVVDFYGSKVLMFGQAAKNLAKPGEMQKMAIEPSHSAPK